jgi:hypothetical protein
MADDVFANAVHPKPAPNIDTNDKIKPQRLVDISEANDMDEDNSNNVILLKVNSYVRNSTVDSVEIPSAATNNNNNLNECPPTPFTSNTTNNKASLQSYLEKTPTKASPDDMVIDITTTPTQPPARSSIVKRSFKQKQTPSPQQELPSPKVPPIRPFTLGQTINMSSLATAVIDAQSQIVQTDNETQTQAIVPADNQSVASMDTSDVSALILKPKSIFNPYSKQHRMGAQIHNSTIQSSNKNDTVNEFRSQTIEIESIHQTNILIPTTHLPSTNEDNIPQTQDQTIVELSQEEAELVSKEIARQEQKWQEIKIKSPNRKHVEQINRQKPIDTNPYSALQDDDTDNETNENINQNHSDSTMEIEPITTTTIMDNETKIPSNTNTESTVSVTVHRTTDTKKQHTPRRNRISNPGRGGGLHMTKSQLSSSTSQEPNEKGTVQGNNENMDIDESPNVPNGSTHQAHANDKENGQRQDNPKNTSNTGKDNENHTPKPQPKRTNFVKHQHTYRILVKAYSNEKEEDKFTRLNILNTVLTALQKSDPVTSLVVPCDENFQTRIYTKINPDSKNKTEYNKIEEMLQFSSSTVIQGTIQVSTNTIYSTIKKNLETRKILQDTHQITLLRNNINAKMLTEVGFFANHLVRHDTIESTRWITETIPPNTPEFQSELITVWGGTTQRTSRSGSTKNILRARTCINNFQSTSTTLQQPKSIEIYFKRIL